MLQFSSLVSARKIKLKTSLLQNGISDRELTRLISSVRICVHHSCIVRLKSGSLVWHMNSYREATFSVTILCVMVRLVLMQVRFCEHLNVVYFALILKE